MKLYVALDESLAPGPKLAQCAHAVSEAHAASPAACAAWRRASNTVAVVELDAARLAELALHPGAAAFREPDLGGALTAVAVIPQAQETRRLLRKARLAG